MITALIFDWGNTVMRDYPEKPGPMAQWDHVEYIPFVEHCLKELSEKYTLCIASNAGFSDTSLMIASLKRVGAEKYFNYFFTSKDLGFEKPDKRFFLSITDKIKLDPSVCVMIGDSYVKDICGAESVGMKTVFFNEMKTAGDYPDADQVIYSMQELISAIDTINK
jgi:FMN phosphatase YigB (HAD superfamily)